jgi:phytoene dehydrogenase-like protein
MMGDLDAVVVGSGPNGLAAAVAIAQTGRKVVVFERNDTIGGGCHSAELTLPGFRHDVCSAVHPFAVGSPFFRSLPLHAHGLRWLEPDVMLAHPFEDGGAACVYRSVDRTAEQLGADAPAYHRLFTLLLEDWPKIERSVLGPLRWPQHPGAMARFGVRAVQPAATMARRTFKDDVARSLFMGIAAHSMLPLDMPPTAGVGLSLNLMAHAAGWCTACWCAKHCECACGLLALAGRRDCHSDARRFDRSAAESQGGPVRPLAGAAVGDCAPPVSAAV